MQVRKPQITIRGMLWATFWMAVCFFTWRLARARNIGEVEFFVLSVSVAIVALGALARNATAGKRSGRIVAMITAVATWEFIAMALTFVYGQTIGRAGLVVYAFYFGETDGLPYTITSWILLILIISTLAGLVSMGTLAAFLRQKCCWKQSLALACLWGALGVGVWLAERGLGFPGWILAQQWQLPVPAVFASPSHDLTMDGSLFAWVPTFQNQLLAIGTEWIVCTLPLACLMLLLYARKWSSEDAAGPISEQNTNST